MSRLWFRAALLLVLGCRGAEAPRVTELAPVSADGQSCGVCGMVVLEQPAPRGQVVHRDGTHAWFCSVGDLRAYVQAPSPHGPVAATWVEAVTVDVDPAVPDASPRPWRPAGDLAYVVGFERAGVMGRPALAFDAVSEAREVALRLGGRVSTWDRLVQVPFNTDPDEE